VCIDRDHAQVVHHPGCLGKEFRDLRTALAVAGEFQGEPKSFLLARLTKLKATSPPYSVPCDRLNVVWGRRDRRATDPRA